MTIEKKLQLDSSPTPEEEAQVFENEDDKKRAHEIELMKAQQGFIGKLTGSCDPGFNFAFSLACIFGLVFIGFCVGFGFSDRFAEPLRYAGTALLTIAAYAFGKKS